MNEYQYKEQNVTTLVNSYIVIFGSFFKHRVYMYMMMLHKACIFSDTPCIHVTTMHADLYLVFQYGVRISIKEHLIDGHVKRWNHFLGVRYQLTIEITVKLTHVFTVEVEERLTNDTYLCTNTHTKSHACNESESMHI